MTRQETLALYNSMHKRKNREFIELAHIHGYKSKHAQADESKEIDPEKLKELQIKQNKTIQKIVLERSIANDKKCKA